jgi:hypothetical protein
MASVIEPLTKADDIHPAAVTFSRQRGGLGRSLVEDDKKDIVEDLASGRKEGSLLPPLDHVLATAGQRAGL